MALLEILKFPDPRLRIKAERIIDFEKVKLYVNDMYETMYEQKGVGLAATQVNIHYRIFTMDVSDSQNNPMCIINPEIISESGEQFEAEGCLSVGGGAFDKVKRAQKLLLRAFNIDGKPLEIKAEGLMAICIQHEIDHLNGILFIDHLSRLKQDRIRQKIEKDKRIK